MADESRSVELQAQLRDLALPWDEGHQVAVASANQTILQMRTAFNEFATKDPYETGRQPETWDVSATLDEDDNAVVAMTRAFMLILSRRGLLKIDLTAPMP